MTTYGYDDANQLTSLTYTLGQTTLGNLTYAYDPSGNRTTVGGTWARTGLPQPVASAAYDAANRVQTWAGQNRMYDLNGNLASDGTKTYAWNARNQLTVVAGDASALFQYDGLGRRRGKTIGGTTTNFLYHGYNAVQELSAGRAPTAFLLTSVGLDEMFTRTDASGTNTLLGDALRSTVALADVSGSVQTWYTYEAFGAASVSGTSNASPTQHTGRENDNTGLRYYRARYYDPSSGRFISEDPFGLEGDGPNFYAYVLNNPLIYIDPFGLSCTCRYRQTTGRMLCIDNTSGKTVVEAIVYSGNTRGLNRPEMQSVPFVGPLPQGGYGMSPSYRTCAKSIALVTTDSTSGDGLLVSTPSVWPTEWLPGFSAASRAHHQPACARTAASDIDYVVPLIDVNYFYRSAVLIVVDHSSFEP